MAEPTRRGGTRCFVCRSGSAMADLWPRAAPGQAQASRLCPQRKTLSLRRPKADREEEDLQDAFYAKLAAQGIADVFHFVNAQCGFLSALTPLQPRYAKK